MERIDVNGIALACESVGAEGAPALVLAHSLAATAGMWDPQMVVLGSRFRVLRFDLRGHGASDAPPGPYAFETMADDVAGLLDAHGLAKAHFVGLSIGGMIGQHFALRHPDRVDRLVLCSTTSRVPPEARPMWNQRIRDVTTGGMETQVASTIERWFTPEFQKRAPEVIGRIKSMIRATPVAGLIGCAHAIRELDLTKKLPAIRQATLVMPGELDQGAPVAASEVIARQIPGARLHVIKGVRHLSNVERPDLFNDALLSFLDAR